MKAVAVALVLIAGAAVVLWYGNTLNSWVLGGLIGGLAALLLSIPISLTLFSYLSKKHDERLQAEEQEAMALAREEYDYRPVPARIVKRPREVEGYVITDEAHEDAWSDEEAHAPRAPRALPSPTQQQRQGNADHNQGSRNSDRFPAPQQGTYVPTQRPQQARPKGKETTALRATTQKIHATGNDATASLSYHRSEALRAARLEAAKQRQDDVEVLPTNTPKRGLSVRPNQALAKQNDHNTFIRPPRPSRQLTQPPAQQPRPVRRVVDSSPPQQRERRASPSDGENAGMHQRVEPQTDYVSTHFQQTSSIRRPSQAGRSTRSLQEDEQRFEEENTTGTMNRPLVRRAPYMYEDDPLRQELAQHLDTPAVRRSSRYDEEGE